MKFTGSLRRVAAACAAVLLTTSCSFQGLNSLALPGAEGRGPEAVSYRIEVANVGSLEPNSPVLVDDVVVGSVRRLSVSDWRALVEVSVRPEVVVPANVAPTVGQTSLLGSMHLALDPPLGEPRTGRLEPGATVPMRASSTYPSTERTLSTLSAVVNSGGLGQIGDIVHSLGTALSTNPSQARELLVNLDTFVATLDDQQSDVVESIRALERLSTTLAAEQVVLDEALEEIPAVLDVLTRQRPRFTTALTKMGEFSDTTRSLVDEAGADLVTNLENLAPTVQALADVGPEIGTAIAYLPVMPFGQNVIDRGIKGDYMNLFAVFDLTVPRLKRTLLSGTRWGDAHIHLVPAPGDPGYDAYYSHDPLSAPINPPAPPAGGG